MAVSSAEPVNTCICSGTSFDGLFVYHEPPDREVRFTLPVGRPYFRRVLRCTNCGHCISVQTMIPDLSELYSGEYVRATYGDLDGVHRQFLRIMALPPEQSDNEARVRRVVEAGVRLLHKATADTFLLDIGSGLGVFPYRIAKEGVHCVCLDPDERAVAHLRHKLGLNAHRGELTAETRLGEFDIVTLNKVLEHIHAPLSFLRLVRPSVREGGIVYIEVPDADAAAREGPGREEFFIDHPHIFSARSLRLLAEQAGFEILEMGSLHEPSTKFTLFAFVRAVNYDAGLSAAKKVQ